MAWSTDIKDLGKNHVFSSFRKRVDSIKIEPSKNLSVRAHDFVDSSYFLASLQHWKEINISGDFTEFVQSVESLCQTLPQLLHYEERIFATLSTHIERADVNSLQPLLELASQFIHDLGPDFMPHYVPFLRLLTNLSQSVNPDDKQNLRNSSNILEWCFNSLAFAFKYLSREIVKDFATTFTEFISILLSPKKAYVSRFCAEALSFLVRKLDQDSLLEVIILTLQTNQLLIEQSESYRTSMVTLYSEAMKNTKMTFHSKSIPIIMQIVQFATSLESHCPKHMSIASDIVLNVIHHGSKESCERLYIQISNQIALALQDDCGLETLTNLVQLLVVLCFLDSGSKISDWDRIFELVWLMFGRAQQCTDSQESITQKLMTNYIHMLAIIIRNCPLSTLTPRLNKLIGTTLELFEGEYHLACLECAIAVSKERMTAFGVEQMVQSYALTHTTEAELARLSLFMVREPSWHINVHSYQHVLSLLLRHVRDVQQVDSTGILWKSVILSRSTCLSLEHMLQIVDIIGSISKVEFSTGLKGEILGNLLTILSSSANSTLSDSHGKQVLEHIERAMKLVLISGTFLDAFSRVIDLWGCASELFVRDHWSELTGCLVSNLSSPDQKLRERSLNLLVKCHEVCGKVVPDTINHMIIIDQIPLIVDNSNDIKMRIRQLFVHVEGRSDMPLIEKDCLAHHVIGLLSNQFQPSWNAVYENLPKLVNADCANQLWTVIKEFLSLNFNDAKLNWNEHPTKNSEINQIHLECQCSDVRMLKSYENVLVAAKISIGEVSKAVECLLESKQAITLHRPLLRGRVIQALQSVPSLAESNGSQFINYAIEKFESYQRFDESKSPSERWSMKEISSLLSVFCKFKSLRKIENNEQLYQIVLGMLTSRQVDTQRTALSILFSWGRLSINKYKDSLNNLLDDKLFRDELQSLLTADSTSKIENQDLSDAIPVVLRLLYGRAKGIPKKSSKAGKKFAVVTVLPNLPPEFIEQFLILTSEQLDYKKMFVEQDVGRLEITTNNLKNITGYLNMLQEIYNALGFKFADILESTISPLMYSLVVAQSAIDRTVDDKEDKVAKNARQLGFKCLSSLFKIMEGRYNWDDKLSFLFDFIVKPRLEKFSQENAQQVSSLMQIMLSWIEWKETLPFLIYQDFAATKALVLTLSNPHTKDAVIDSVLDFCITSLAKEGAQLESYYKMLAIIVDTLLEVLPAIIEKASDRDINSKAASVFLLIIEGGYINDESTRRQFVAASVSALDKPPAQIGLNDKVSILLSLSSIIDLFSLSSSELNAVVEVCARAFKIYKDRSVRESLVKVFTSIGKRMGEFAIIAELLESLNSYSGKRFQEPDFERRLSAFKEINETLYHQFSLPQWMPLINCAFFFMNDHEELALRTNASYLLMRFIDRLSEMDVICDINARKVFNSFFMPNVRLGLKKDKESVREGFIHVLAHVVRNSESFPEFDGLKVLANADCELDFFANITHIQLTARQRAIRGLIDMRSQMSDECIYHYILPITEVYTVCQDEKYRNILDDTHEVWAWLARRMKWVHYKELFKKHMSLLRRAPENELRDRVNLITRLSQALIASYRNHKLGQEEDVIQDFPSQDQLDSFVLNDCIPALLNILKVRNDDTIIARAPLSEAAVNFVLCTSENIVLAELPGTLTSTCQVLRSHTQHLRDAVRKTLGKIAKNLGPQYFKFIIKELKSALSRGAQIHVLSYTVHSLLISVTEGFVSGDLDESVDLIAGVIMEDTFGAAGQDKDAEDYVSKMREVKLKKSFDLAELLSSNISLHCFLSLIEPVKLLLQENLPLRTQRKLDDLLQRYAMGLNHNVCASTQDMLLLCFEIYQLSFVSIEKKRRKSKVDGQDDHYMVQLNSKVINMKADASQHLTTLQKLAFELLRTALGKHLLLITVSNLDGFLPLLETSLRSDDELLLVSVFKLLNLVVKLPFAESRDQIFEVSVTKAFTILQNAPTTSSDLSQICLKYLATVVRHKPSLQLSENALSVVLTKIRPDLEEPDKQRLAFNFLKSLLSQHIMLPEVYEIMEKVANIMIVNHSREIRDISRNLFFQFLMEYEQGARKLNSAFKFLVSNLAYPTYFGRQSVMELLHSIILRSSKDIVNQLASSFFVGLANVMVSDESAKCREMATSLIKQIMIKMRPDGIDLFENFCRNWIHEKSNNLLQRCGLLVYRIYIGIFGVGYNQSLDKDILSLVETNLERSRADNLLESLEWEDVYTALSVISTCASSIDTKIFLAEFENIWRLIISSLLYPHAWVRLSSSKLTGLLLSHVEDAAFEISPYEIQTIAYRTFRQLSAPGITKELGAQIVKNLTAIIGKWEAEETEYIAPGPNSSEHEISLEPITRRAGDFAISRLCAVMRQETHKDTSEIPKMCTIQISAILVQSSSVERAQRIADQLLGGLLHLVDPNTSGLFSEDLIDIAKECMKLIEDKIGVTNYTTIFSRIMKQVDDRRSDRRAKRAYLAVSAPELAARKKIRKHERFRENRKHERDENGYYKPKRSKRF